MHATTNLNDASNEQTRLRNIVWLWCISEGYEDVSTGESICFTKNQKTTTFILETNKSRAELLTCIYEATEKYDYIFVVINDSSTKNPNIHFFSCSNYVNDYRGTCQTRHYVRADAIEEVVTYELQRLADYLKYDQDGFAELLAEKTNKDMLNEQKNAKTQIDQSLARINKIDVLYERLYEDNVSGKVTSLWR